ncbi:MAG: hypothetical protein ACJAVN_000431 [Roseivirga sp.]
MIIKSTLNILFSKKPKYKNLNGFKYFRGISEYAGRLLLLTFFSYFISFTTYSQTATVKAGSIIIDMGVSPQTVGNALKPYGLVHSLIKAPYYTPVIWSINPAKAKDGVDFTIDGRDFKGGTFIIRKDYLTTDVLAQIAAFEALGVITYTTQTTVIVPLYKDLEYFAQWALDADNGALAEPYLINAGIPDTDYDIVDPANLGICNDLYIMPHADPKWATHENLLDWNNSEANGGFQGWIWSGCHAVSVLEGLVDPNDNTRRTNFLARTPDTPPTDPVNDNNPKAVRHSLVNYDDHADATVSTTNFQSAFPAEAAMQFLGNTYGAHKNGSEQIYLPYLTGGWRPTTRVGAWDPNQADIPGQSPGKAALIAFGFAFGDANRGKVMYEGGHRLNDAGTSAEQIAAQRAFFNFSFDAPQNKKPQFIDNSVDVPVVLGQGETIDFEIEASAFTNLVMDSVIWVSNTEGTFVDSFTGNQTQFVDGIATFTAPNNLTSDITAIITAIARDDCGRVSLLKWTITILAAPEAPVANDDNRSGYTSGTVTLNALANDMDVNDDIDPTTFTTLSPLVVANKGTFVDNGNGNITFIPESGFTGDATLTYEVTDLTSRTSNVATITITIEADPISCGPFQSISESSSGNIYASAATGTSNTPTNAVGNTPGSSTEIAEGEDITLEFANITPPSYDFTLYWDDIKNDNDLTIELLDENSSVVQIFDQGAEFTAPVDFGSTTLTANFSWKYIKITQNGTRKNGKGKLAYAETVDFVITCIDDRDGDLIPDSIDLDDDNDGILDTVEGVGTACSQTEEIVSLTTQLIFNDDDGSCVGTPFNNLVLGTCTLGYFGTAPNTGPIAGLEILDFRFSQALVITELKVLTDRTNSFLLSGATVQVEGSNDGIAYTLIVAPPASNGVAEGNEEVFDLSNNSIAYEYYRILGVSGNYGWDPYLNSVDFTAAPCVPTSATDTDGDGVPDYLDLDSDNDGIPDNIEAQTTNGYIAPSGVFGANGVDTAYGGGLTPVNTDGTDNPDYLDLDSDNEGGYDIEESGAGLSHTNGVTNGTVGDNGLDNTLDNGGDTYIDVNGSYDNTQTDNFDDSDGDVNGGGDVDYRDNLAGADTDGDGILDSIDLDDDNDGILDTIEGEFDTDGDGIVNRLDLDSDGDGIPDNIEAQTTLGYIPQGTFTDTNNNGVNDVYDTTNGGTGITPVNTDLADNPDYLDLNSDNKTGNDTSEGGLILNGVIGANGLDTAISDGTYTDVNGYFDDTQSDNFPDADGDVNLGGDVDWRDAVTGIDSDNDGVLDPQDIDDDNDGILDVDENGGVDPLLDSDIDGIYDYQDADAAGFVDVNSDGIDDRFDLDLDGIINQYDLDSDNDGIPDIVEAGGVNANGDGIVDGTFTDTDDDGWSNVFDNDNGGTALADPDTDGDGFKNRGDLDSDNDGIPDIVEAQSTTGYVAPTGVDSDGDGIDNAFDPDSGGTLSVTPVNTDGTDNPDYLDLDSDNDGTFDIVESGSGLSHTNGKTNGAVGANGLDNTLDNGDTFVDPNGNLDNSQSDNFTDTDGDVLFLGDVDYRDDELNAPGGIFDCLLLWLKANQGGTSWANAYGGNVNVSQSGTVSSGSLLNFNATNNLQAIGHYDTDLDINASTRSDLTVFVVYAPENQNAGAIWGENNGGFDRYLRDFDVSNGTGVELISGIFVNDSPYLTTTIFDEDVNNGSFVYTSGGLVKTFTSNHGVESSNDLQIGALGASDSRFNGRIAEVLVYCQLVAGGSDRQKIETYLALKYGITLSSDSDGDLTTFEAGEGDYIATNGTVIWDASVNSVYHNGVAGILRDDTSLISQKQSKSSTADAIVTIGLDDQASPDGLEASNPANDGTFDSNTTALIWGHDNADLEGGTGTPGETEFDPAQVKSRLNREWYVQETGQTGTVTVQFDVSGLLGPDNTIGTSDENQIVLMVDADGDFSTNASIITQSFSVSDDGIVTFLVDLSNGAYFTLGSTEQGALPITLISFNVNCNENNEAKLEWVTSSETNNSFYTIERSSDGDTFERLGYINGAGNSEALLYYSFVDSKPVSGLSFYRLKQTDFSGEFEYSEIRSIRIERQLITSYTAYPNPVDKGESLRIAYSSQMDQTLQLAYVNTRGQIIAREEKVVSVDGEFIEVSTSKLDRGLNLIRIIDKFGKLVTLKVIVR